MMASILLGMGLAALNGLAGYMTIRSALPRPDIEFVKRGVGGMAVRFLCMLLVLVLIVKFAPVNLPAFVGGFMAAAVFGLIAEVLLLHRRVSQAGAS